MSRKTNTTRSYPCVLKTIINDAHTDNKSFALNDKQIRSRLRARFMNVENASHIKNTSWIAMNAREYDALRCAFDAMYAHKIANARKRVAKTRVVDATS